MQLRDAAESLGSASSLDMARFPAALRAGAQTVSQPPPGHSHCDGAYYTTANPGFERANIPPRSALVDERQVFLVF